MRQLPNHLHFAALAVLPLGLACSPCPTSVQSATTCGFSGGATLEAPDILPAGKPLFVTGGRACESDPCPFPYALWLNVADDPNAFPDFSLEIAMPGRGNAFMLSLPDPAVSVFASWDQNVPSMGLQPLSLLSGTIDVHDASIAGYQATFTLLFGTNTGQRVVSVTGGQANISDCHTDQMCHRGE